MIYLGKQGENGVTQIKWEGYAADWREKYGDGSFQLAYQRKGDEAPSPVVIDVEEDDILWTITSSDTFYEGDGHCELSYYVGEAVAKSQTWTTCVCPSLTGDDGTEPPASYQSWVDEVLSAATKILSAIPEGGVRGQVLTKKSDTSYDTVWSTVQSGGGGSSDENYVFMQAIASDTWTIHHGLAKFPSVTIIDSGNNAVIGDVEYIDSDTVVCHFSSAFSGKAYLN